MVNASTHIKGIPKSLTKEETNHYLNLLREGDKSARQVLIEGNLKLVLYFINSKFHHLPYDKEELFQIGCIGLIKGIDSYDSNKNVELVTYVSRCITNEILMLARKDCSRPIEDSLNKPIFVNDSDSTDTSLMDVIESDDDLVDDYENKEQLFIAMEIIKRLPAKYRLMIEMYFGLNGQKKHTQRELASYFKTSQCNISRILNKLLTEIENEIESINVNELYHSIKPVK